MDNCIYFQHECCTLGNSCRFQHPGNGSGSGTSGSSTGSEWSQSPTDGFSNTISVIINRTYDNRSSDFYHEHQADIYSASAWGSAGGYGSNNDLSQINVIVNQGAYKIDSGFGYCQANSQNYRYYNSEDCGGYGREAESFAGLGGLSFEETCLAAYETSTTGNATNYLAYISELAKGPPNAPPEMALIHLIDDFKISPESTVDRTTNAVFSVCENSVEMASPVCYFDSKLMTL